MNHEEDVDLARRLQLIAAAPEPEVPGSLYRFVDSIADGAAADLTEGSLAPIAFMPAVVRERRRPPASQLKRMIGVAAALLLAIAGGSLIVGLQHASPAASPVPAADQWTGLEWHDITATSDGLFIQEASSSSWGAYANVVAFDGSYFATGFGVVSGQIMDAIWTSHDGLVWSRVPGAPYVSWLGVLNGRLVAQGTSALPASWVSWTSTDGINWESHVESFADSESGMGSWVTTSTAALVEVQPYLPLLPFETPAATAISDTSGGVPTFSYIAPTVPYAQPDFYVTTDGVSWRKGTLPTDLQGSQGVQFFSWKDSFVMEATIDDPAGRGYRVDAQGKEIHQADHLWTSHDGQSWTRLDTSAVGIFMSQLQVGSLGLSIPPIGSDGFHSADGNHWTQDEDAISILNNANLGSSATWSVQSDGRHILVTADWDVKFSVSLGDGHWRTLRQGGDIGSLPGGGQAFLLPNGVLYAGGGRLFYGEAVAGRQPTGELHPAATITQAPTPTPVGYTPRPKDTQEPAVSWTGVTGIAKVAGGPAGATSVTRWKNGFIAIANATDPQNGSFTAWSSPDGVSWAKIPDGTFGSHPTAQAAQDGDLVDIATWGGAVQVWSSADGLTWQQAAISGPPIGGRPMAGNSQGVVALMDDPRDTIFSDMGNSMIPDTGIHSLHSVAVSNGQWVVVGQSNGDLPTPAAPAAWWSSDGVAWTPAVVDSAPGECLVQVVAGRDGFIAIGSTDGKIADATSFWTSSDGKSWHRSGTAMGPFPGTASFAGDGNRIVGWGLGASGSVEYWTSQDGQAWTQLKLTGDTTALLSAKNAYVFPVENGVLFTTADGAWYGPATVQK
jgi:hypothetical protein